MIKSSVIAKNTFFLYIRMILVLVTTLYTSRVVLQVVGVVDYGIYQTVGGVVAFLAMANTALSIGTSRFLTYELGTGNQERLNDLFCMTFWGHLLLAVVICGLAETAGLWFVYNKLDIPLDRMDAAVFSYHMTVLTAFFLLSQAPYTALIIAHEKMKIYAYVSIIEVVMKLGIVFSLTAADVDKLKLYAFLLFVVQFSLVVFYRVYCLKNFKEASLHLIWNADILKPIFKFSGLNFVMEAAKALNNQGFIVLTNVFFGPAVVAARAIALQVNSAANQFVNNFRLASNPQIIKLEASGNIGDSHKLVLQSAKYTYFLMLFLALPIVLGSKQLLRLWLGQVPDYSVIFLQLAVIQSLVTTFDLSFHHALLAKGRLREETITSFLVILVGFVFVYILFYLEYSPISLCLVAIAQYALLGLIVKPILMHKISGYKYSDIIKIFLSCIKVSVAAAILPVTVKIYFSESLTLFVMSSIASLFSVGLSIYFLGIDKETRIKFNSLLLKKYNEIFR